MKLSRPMWMFPAILFVEFALLQASNSSAELEKVQETLDKTGVIKDVGLVKTYAKKLRDQFGEGKMPTNIFVFNLIKMYDFNGDGKIDDEELSLVLKHGFEYRYGDKTVSDGMLRKRVNTILHTSDSNKDGFLAYSEIMIPTN